MSNERLFSVAIVSFNQRPLIEECIDSILEQTYPSIELIICDDNSCDFNEKEIRDYIEKNKRKNIKNIEIFHHLRNVGTSANCQKALELAHGQYFKLQAADDMLINADVLETISNYFRIESNNVLIGRAQACTHNGQMTSDIYPPFDNFIKAQNATPHELFGLMSTQPWGAFVCAPAVFWRTSFLKKLGGFDLTYRYTEDWPLWLKICSLNEPIRYIDDITTIYRYGGISNDQSELNQSIGRLHYAECIKMLKEVSMPVLKREYSRFAQLRCWHSIKSIEARIVAETEWYRWSLREKVFWKFSNMPFLFIKKLFHIRWYGFSFPFKKIIKLMLFVIFLSNMNVYLYPTHRFLAVWTFIFIMLSSLLILGSCLKILTYLFRWILDLRIRRNSQ